MIRFCILEKLFRCSAIEIALLIMFSQQLKCKEKIIDAFKLYFSIGICFLSLDSENALHILNFHSSIYFLIYFCSWLVGVFHSECTMEQYPNFLSLVLQFS
jgi:hypothetical protein